MSVQDSISRIIRDVGGKDNIIKVSHCATRMRITVADNKNVDKGDLEKIEKVLGANVIGNEVHVVLGGIVNQYYDAMQSAIGTVSDKAVNSGKKGNVWLAILNYVAGTMTPLIPALIGCSMIRGIITLLTQFHIMDNSSSTYAILFAASNAIFYFLPILTAYSAAKKLKVNPVIAACISAALMEPNFTALMTNTGDIVKFLGIPVMMFSYSGSLIPAMLATWLYSLAWKWLEKHVPTSIAGVVNPTVCLAVFVPLTAIVFGPIAYYFGEGIGNLFNAINNFSPVLAGIIIGVSMMYLTITGLHWVVTALCLNEFAMYGYSTLFGYWWTACVSVVGLAIGSLIIAKTKEEKSYASSCLLTNLIGGVSEPILYGYLLRDHTYAIPMAISGAFGGAIAGLLGTKATAFSMATVFTVSCVEMHGSFITSAIVFLIEIVIGTATTVIFVGRKKKAAATEA